MLTLVSTVRRAALMIGAFCIPLITPVDLAAQISRGGKIGDPRDVLVQRTVRISGPFRDVPSEALSSDALQSMLAEAYNAARIRLPRGALNRIMEVYGTQPDVEIVVFDAASGRAIPAQLEGEASFSVGALADARKVCGRPCAGFERARLLRLESIDARVSGPAIGTVAVSRSTNARALGVLDPATGRAYVEWPVRLRIPRSQLFEREFQVETVFRGFGQLKEDGGFLVVDVARVVVGDREFSVNNKNCTGNCIGRDVPLEVLR